MAAVAETVATAGKAVAFSAATVLASLASILIIPSAAFRSMAFEIMLSVIAVLAATLTLLPAVLGTLGTKVNSGRLDSRRGHPVRPAGAADPGPGVLLAGFPVVIFDEPAEHLDQDTAAELARDLLSATEGKTVLLITRRPVEPGPVDQVLRLG